jgi:hypothetical protein
MHKKHKVRAHHWKNGRLETVDHFFDSIEEAKIFVITTSAHTSKIYDEDGELLDTVISTAIPDQISTPETYA